MFPTLVWLGRVFAIGCWGIKFDFLYHLVVVVVFVAPPMAESQAAGGVLPVSFALDFCACSSGGVFALLEHPGS